jgi:hypothetical protein
MNGMERTPVERRVTYFLWRARGDGGDKSNEILQVDLHPAQEQWPWCWIRKAMTMTKMMSSRTKRYRYQLSPDVVDIYMDTYALPKEYWGMTWRDDSAKSLTGYCVSNVNTWQLQHSELYSHQHMWKTTHNLAEQGFCLFFGKCAWFESSWEKWYPHIQPSALHRSYSPSPCALGMIILRHHVSYRLSRGRPQLTWW